MPKIKTRYWPDGSVKDYEFVADVGRHPDGRRHQQRFRFARMKDAQFELNRLGYQRPRGEYVPRWNGTLNDLLDAYERAACRGKELNTQVSYRGALRIPRERLGRRRAQGISRDDIEQLVDWTLTHGRKRGGEPGTGLSVRSAKLMLQQLSAAFEMAVDDQKLARNPCRRVRVDGKPKRQAVTWSATELLRFLAVADADRLAACWRLTLYGERRGEVLGQRWADWNRGAGTITVGRARVLADGRVIEKAPKSERGYRTLPLDAAATAALEALQARQLEEMDAAGTAYVNSGYIAADELGRPLHPDRYSDEFARLCREAGLPVIRLHDARHTVNSLMAAVGVPDHIRAAWCGHTTAVNVSTYTHARPEDLALAAEALDKIHNAAA